MTVIGTIASIAGLLFLAAVLWSMRLPAAPAQGVTEFAPPIEGTGQRIFRVDCSHPTNQFFGEFDVAKIFGVPRPYEEHPDDPTLIVTDLEIHRTAPFEFEVVATYEKRPET